MDAVATVTGPDRQLMDGVRQHKIPNVGCSETSLWWMLRTTENTSVFPMVVLWVLRMGVEGIAAINLCAERDAKVAWKQVLRIIVYWLDLDGASRLWEGEAWLQIRALLEVGLGRRVRMQRLADDWALCGNDSDDKYNGDPPCSSQRIAAQDGAHRRVGTCRHCRK